MASKVIVPTPGIKKMLHDRGVPESKVEVVYNWVDPSQLKFEESARDFKKNAAFENRFNIVFAGNMGKAQALETVLEAADFLKESNPHIQFVFIGGGVDVDNLKTQSRQMGLHNVRFLPPVPFSEVGSILKASDILLVHLKKNPLFEITIPSKIQAYLAAGKPILCAVPGDASDLVLKAEAGLICPPEDPDQLAQTVLKFSKMPPNQLAEMGLNGMVFYKKNMCLEVGAGKFENLFKEIVF